MKSEKELRTQFQKVGGVGVAPTFLRYTLAAALFCIGGSGALRATTIGLLNTGEASNGSLLASSAVDPGYTLSTSLVDPLTGSVFGPNSYVANFSDGDCTSPTENNCFPAQWVPNTSTAEWIAPLADAHQSANHGTTGEFPVTTGPFETNGQISSDYYDFSTTFTISDLASAESFDLSGVWASDNGVYLWVNGVYTGVEMNESGTVDFNSLSGFSVSNADCPGGCFTAGVNTITFEVDNSINNNGPTYPDPTGLLVEFTVPEPASLLMCSLGLLAIGLSRVRRTR